MKKFKVIFLGVLLLPGLLLAQQSQWRLANGTSGISIADIDIYFSNPDTIYASGFGFLLRSTDRGENWNTISAPDNSGPIFYTLKVHPYNSNIIYLSWQGPALDSWYVSMTKNGGQSWEELFYFHSSPPAPPVIEIAIGNPCVMYVGQGKILYRSRDCGQTWDSLPYLPIFAITSLVIAPSNKSVLYAGFFGAGIWKSTDEGNSWTELWNESSSGFTFSGDILLAVHPYNTDTVYTAIYSRGSFQGGVYKSTNGGLIWNEMNNGLDSTNWDIHDILINPENPNELFISNGGIEGELISKTTDGGNSWFGFNKNGLPDPGGIGPIAIDTLNNRIYAGCSGYADSTRGLYIYDGLISFINDNAKILQASDKFSLHQNYPNPFNTTTTISYTLSEGVSVSLSVYDISGKEVRKLVQKFNSAGMHTVKLDAKDLPSGVYFYRLIAGEKTITRKALLVK